jgi:menaquinone-9 beta-reductase
MTYDFVIIGGGPAGSTAASLLAQRGLRTILCEQKPFPRPKVCGEFMSTRLRPILRELALEADFDRLAGPPIRRVVAYPRGQVTLRGRFPAQPDGAFPRALARDQLDALLLHRAEELGAAIVQPCLATAVTGSLAGGFQVNTTAAGILHSRAVILAHGLAQRGDMDPMYGGHPARKPTEFICFKAHFTACQLPDDTIALAAAPGLYAGLVRTSDLAAAPRYSLALVIRRRRIDDIGNSGEAQFQDLLRANPAFAALLTDASRLSPWLASGPLQPGIREVYRDGRFFIGNAAGEVHALVGEGLTLALVSAQLLANSLTCTTRAGLADAGRNYEGRWRRLFLPRYYAANLFAHIMMRPTLAAPFSRCLRALPPLMNWCIRASGKSP